MSDGCSNSEAVLRGWMMHDDWATMARRLSALQRETSEDVTVALASCIRGRGQKEELNNN